ncbi:MAG: DUF418 domain-containing protein [Marinifilaceae bacterium]
MISTTKQNRIVVVDALRGFAVAAIMLLHFIEHFIYGVYPEPSGATMQLINQSVWDGLFFIFAGKSYTIFALLFGFTFIIQQRNQEMLGRDFGSRFAWRLVLLMGFATLNAAFFPGGDVLLLFAVMGFVMIPLRKLSEKALLAIALLFLIQPIELLECLGINLIPTVLDNSYYPALKTVTDQGNFWQMIVTNITTGQIASLFWAVDAGRLLQAPGLFIMGMILAKGDYFNRAISFWSKVLVTGFIGCFVLYVAKTSATNSLQIIFTMWYNIAFTAILISTFVILYQSDAFRNMTDGLRFYGKMSLTNYITQSIIGSILFFPFAFGLAAHVGIAGSLLIGIAVMLAQIAFCKYWLQHHKQGPLEQLWHKLTWINEPSKVKQPQKPTVKQ